MNTVRIQKINNIVVKPVRGMGEVDHRPVKGESLFSEIYANIFLCAKKKSGKTSVIAKIIKECTTSETKVIVFSSTFNKDDIWRSIEKFCDLRRIDFLGMTSLVEDGVDQLDSLVKDLERAKRPETEKKLAGHGHLLWEDEEEDEKPKKLKYRAPEFLIVLDDLSTELKSKSLTALLKKNRHFRMKIVISSQYWNDLLPESRKQLDYILVFKAIPENKLEEIYHDADLSIPFEQFVVMYHQATKQQFSFLYIDTRNEEFRRNFNSRLQYIEEDDGDRDLS